MIVLLSDHGYLLGERGLTGKVPSQLHPELAQVPFIVAHPDGRAAGEVSSHFASTHDVGPDAPVAWSAWTARAGWRASTSPRCMDGEQPSGRRPFHYGGMYNRFFIRTDEWLLIGDNRGAGTHACTT